jgi:hypothetical protein
MATTWWFYHEVPKRKGLDYQVSQCQSQLKDLHVAMGVFLNDNEFQKPQITNILTAWAGGRPLYQDLSGGLGYYFTQWKRSGKIADPWGTPFRFRVIEWRTNECRYVLWSCGPNRRDNHGARDDVVGDELAFSLP